MFSDDRNHTPAENGQAMASKPEPWITREQYLESERAAETRSEYLNGSVRGLAGASWEHNVIVGNLVATLHAALQGGACRVSPSDLRIRASETGLYTYPDVSVVCGVPKFEDAHRDTLLNPTFLIEVLSESTERYDRGRKAEHYRTITSLEEYLLVAQAEPRIERYRRQSERDWIFTEVSSLDEQIELPSIACVLRLRDVYDGVLPDVGI